jgi:O-methyltransferase
MEEWTLMANAWLKLKQFMRRCRGIVKDTILTKSRRILAEFLLPEDCFVQQNPNFNYVLHYFPQFIEDSKLFNNEFTRANKKLLRDGNRWLSINLLLDIANLCAKGDYAELGTYQGATARLIWNRLPNESALYCFDTFEGFSEADIVEESEHTAVKTKAGSFGNTSVDLVRHAVLRSKMGSNDSRLVFRKGRFPETFDGLQNHWWRFVHLDCDLYAPIKSGIECFWPKLVPGGILLVHDYNAAFFGVKKAVDEYFKPLGIVPVPLCDKVGSVVIIKNRDSHGSGQ